MARNGTGTSSEQGKQSGTENVAEAGWMDAASGESAATAEALADADDVANRNGEIENGIPLRNITV